MQCKTKVADVRKKQGQQHKSQASKQGEKGSLHERKSAKGCICV